MPYVPHHTLNSGGGKAGGDYNNNNPHSQNVPTSLHSSHTSLKCRVKKLNSIAISRCGRMNMHNSRTHAIPRKSLLSTTQQPSQQTSLPILRLNSSIQFHTCRVPTIITEDPLDSQHSDSLISIHPTVHHTYHKRPSLHSTTRRSFNTRTMSTLPSNNTIIPHTSPRRPLVTSLFSKTLNLTPSTSGQHTATPYSYTVGLDLGHDFTSVAVAHSLHDIQYVKNRVGHYHTPSVVYINPKTQKIYPGYDVTTLDSQSAPASSQYSHSDVQFDHNKDKIVEYSLFQPPNATTKQALSVYLSFLLDQTRRQLGGVMISDLVVTLPTNPGGSVDDKGNVTTTNSAISPEYRLLLSQVFQEQKHHFRINNVHFMARPVAAALANGIGRSDGDASGQKKTIVFHIEADGSIECTLLSSDKGLFTPLHTVHGHLDDVGDGGAVHKGFLAQESHSSPEHRNLNKTQKTNHFEDRLCPFILDDIMKQCNINVLKDPKLFKSFYTNFRIFCAELMQNPHAILEIPTFRLLPKYRIKNFQHQRPHYTYRFNIVHLQSQSNPYADAIEQQRLKYDDPTNTLNNIPHLNFLLHTQPDETLTTLERQKYLRFADQLLRDQNLTCRDVDHVILSGATNFHPPLYQYLLDHFTPNPNDENPIFSHLGQTQEDKIIVHCNPAYAGATGAAMHAAILKGRIAPTTVLPSLPHSLGVSLSSEKLFLPLIPRGTPLPTSQIITVDTIRDYQGSVQLDLYHGESDNCKYNAHIGLFKFRSIIPNIAGAERVKVVLNVTEYGVLNIIAQELTNGVTEAVSFKLPQQIGVPKGTLTSLMLELNPFSHKHDNKLPNPIDPTPLLYKNDYISETTRKAVLSYEHGIIIDPSDITNTILRPYVPHSHTTSCGLDTSNKPLDIVTLSNLRFQLDELNAKYSHEYHALHNDIKLKRLQEQYEIEMNGGTADGLAKDAQYELEYQRRVDRWVDLRAQWRRDEIEILKITQEGEYSDGNYTDIEVDDPDIAGKKLVIRKLRRPARKPRRWEREVDPENTSKLLKEQEESFWEKLDLFGDGTRIPFPTRGLLREVDDEHKAMRAERILAARAAGREEPYSEDEHGHKRVKKELTSEKSANDDIKPLYNYTDSDSEMESFYHRGDVPKHYGQSEADDHFGDGYYDHSGHSSDPDEPNRLALRRRYREQVRLWKNRKKMREKHDAGLQLTQKDLFELEKMEYFQSRKEEDAIEKAGEVLTPLELKANELFGHERGAYKKYHKRLHDALREQEDLEQPPDTPLTPEQIEKRRLEDEKLQQILDEPTDEGFVDFPEEDPRAFKYLDDWKAQYERVQRKKASRERLKENIIHVASMEDPISRHPPIPDPEYDHADDLNLSGSDIERIGEDIQHYDKFGQKVGKRGHDGDILLKISPRTADFFVFDPLRDLTHDHSRETGQFDEKSSPSSPKPNKIDQNGDVIEKSFKTAPMRSPLPILPFLDSAFLWGKEGRDDEMVDYTRVRGDKLTPQQLRRIIIRYRDQDVRIQQFLASLEHEPLIIPEDNNTKNENNKIGDDTTSSRDTTNEANGADESKPGTHTTFINDDLSVSIKPKSPLSDKKTQERIAATAQKNIQLSRIKEQLEKYMEYQGFDKGLAHYLKYRSFVSPVDEFLESCTVSDNDIGYLLEKDVEKQQKEQKKQQKKDGEEEFQIDIKTAKVGKMLNTLVNPDYPYDLNNSTRLCPSPIHYRPHGLPHELLLIQRNYFNDLNNYISFKIAQKQEQIYQNSLSLAQIRHSDTNEIEAAKQERRNERLKRKEAKLAARQKKLEEKEKQRKLKLEKLLAEKQARKNRKRYMDILLMDTDADTDNKNDGDASDTERIKKEKKAEKKYDEFGNEIPSPPEKKKRYKYDWQREAAGLPPKEEVSDVSELDTDDLADEKIKRLFRKQVITPFDDDDDDDDLDSEEIEKLIEKERAERKEAKTARKAKLEERRAKKEAKKYHGKKGDDNADKKSTETEESEKSSESLDDLGTAADTDQSETDFSSSDLDQSSFIPYDPTRRPKPHLDLEISQLRTDIAKMKFFANKIFSAQELIARELKDPTTPEELEFIKTVEERYEERKDTKMREFLRTVDRRPQEPPKGVLKPPPRFNVIPVNDNDYNTESEAEHAHQMTTEEKTIFDRFMRNNLPSSSQDKSNIPIFSSKMIAKLAKIVKPRNNSDDVDQIPVTSKISPPPQPSSSSSSSLPHKSQLTQSFSDIDENSGVKLSLYDHLLNKYHRGVDSLVKKMTGHDVVADDDEFSFFPPLPPVDSDKNINSRFFKYTRNTALGPSTYLEEPQRDDANHYAYIDTLRKEQIARINADKKLTLRERFDRQKQYTADLLKLVYGADYSPSFLEEAQILDEDGNIIGKTRTLKDDALTPYLPLHSYALTHRHRDSPFYDNRQKVILHGQNRLGNMRAFLRANFIWLTPDEVKDIRDLCSTAMVMLEETDVKYIDLMSTVVTNVMERHIKKVGERQIAVREWLEDKQRNRDRRDDEQYRDLIEQDKDEHDALIEDEIQQSEPFIYDRKDRHQNRIKRAIQREKERQHDAEAELPPDFYLNPDMVNIADRLPIDAFVPEQGWDLDKHWPILQILRQNGIMSSATSHSTMQYPNAPLSPLLLDVLGEKSNNKNVPIRYDQYNTPTHLRAEEFNDMFNRLRLRTFEDHYEAVKNEMTNYATYEANLSEIFGGPEQYAKVKEKSRRKQEWQSFKKRISDELHFAEFLLRKTYAQTRYDHALDDYLTWKDALVELTASMPLDQSIATRFVGEDPERPRTFLGFGYRDEWERYMDWKERKKSQFDAKKYQAHFRETQRAKAGQVAMASANKRLNLTPHGKAGKRRKSKRRRRKRQRRAGFGVRRKNKMEKRIFKRAMSKASRDQKLPKLRRSRGFNRLRFFMSHRNKIKKEQMARYEWANWKRDIPEYNNRGRDERRAKRRAERAKYQSVYSNAVVESDIDGDYADLYEAQDDFADVYEDEDWEKAQKNYQDITHGKYAYATRFPNRDEY